MTDTLTRNTQSKDQRRTSVRFTFTDGETAEYEIIGMPWQWRTFTVINRGPAHLLGRSDSDGDLFTYIPTENLSHFDVL